MKELSEALVNKFSESAFDNLTEEEQREIVEYISQIPQFVANMTEKMIREAVHYLESQQILVRSNNDNSSDWILSEEYLSKLQKDNEHGYSLNSRRGEFSPKIILGSLT